ncbi:MAG: response regulator [Pseudomonadota bacterium]
MQRILVVDDDPNERALLEAALSLEGYTVRTAGDGDEALYVLDSERPDAVITDLIMPGTDGLGVCRAIRARPELEDMSIVALTGGEYPQELTGLCDVFLRKPVDVGRLVDTLQQLAASKLLNALPLVGHGLRW